MIAAAQTWWRARTAREKLLLRAGAFFVLFALLPLSAFQAVSSFRSDAAARLESAREIERRVAQLASAGAAAETDGTTRGAALAAAEALGLTLARLEPRGQGALLVVFEGADSVRVYRWLEMVGRAGALAQRTQLTRVGEAGLVNAEIEVRGGP